jgi:hypothetical protein
MGEEKIRILNIEPDFVGLWKYFMHMKQTNIQSFKNVFPDGEDDKEWTKIKRLGEAGCHSVQEYVDQQQKEKK